MQDNTKPENTPNFPFTTSDGRKNVTYLCGPQEKSTPLIPFNKYFIDSSKFYIDYDLLLKVNIPNEFLLVDKIEGNVIDDFKKNCLNLPYKDHKIYLAIEEKYTQNRWKPELAHKLWKKVMFYFPAKINPSGYFFGITKEMVIDVLTYIKSLGYIDFENIEDIFNQIELKDLDMKKDMQFNWTDKEKIVKYNNILSDRFNGYPPDFKSFNNKANGLGIQTYNRNNSTIKKPFLKFYSKSDEILKKENESLFNSMPLELQTICNQYLIYRYEFTIKKMNFFNHFSISNKLKDVLEISQDKWKEIGKYYLITNFQTEIKTPLDVSKLKPIETIICLMIYDLIQLGRSIKEIELMFLNNLQNRPQKKRNKMLFERCYYYASVPNEQTKELLEKYNTIKALDEIFGF
jgi:hypothetical protein